jgi:hypothetical protein
MAHSPIDEFDKSAPRLLSRGITEEIGFFTLITSLYLHSTAG